jgi:hypothetical protein
MLLRRSGEIQEENYDLTGVTGQGTIGVENEETLNAIADAVFYADAGDLEKIRAQAILKIGDQQLTDAFAVASAFNGITKVANATGIPLDARTEEVTVELRQSAGIDDYSDAFKSGQYG